MGRRIGELGDGQSRNIVERQRIIARKPPMLWRDLACAVLEPPWRIGEDGVEAATRGAGAPSTGARRATPAMRSASASARNGSFAKTTPARPLTGRFGIPEFCQVRLRKSPDR
jgi:hypothetical protein